jgi:hypothetical protein
MNAQKLSDKIKITPIKRGQTLYMRFSGADVGSFQFVRWQTMKMHTGREDTHKPGVGCVGRSSWRFSKCIIGRVPKGLKRGQDLLRPYWDLYTSERGARTHNKRYLVKRPPVEHVRKLQKRRK